MARSLWSPGILFLAGVENIEITGIENVDINKTYVVAANHASYLDIPILFKVLPIDLYFIAKKQLQYVPFIGWYMMATGMLFINRKSKEKSVKSLNSASQKIRGGRNIFVFPEGTRTKTGEIGDFKPGAFIIAKKANVDILPIKIEGSGEIWDVKHGKINPGNIRVKIQPSIPSSNLKETLLGTKKSILEA